METTWKEVAQALLMALGAWTFGRWVGEKVADVIIKWAKVKQ